MAEKNFPPWAVVIFARYSCLYQPSYHRLLPEGITGFGRRETDGGKTPILSICKAFFVKDKL